MSRTGVFLLTCASLVPFAGATGEEPGDPVARFRSFLPGYRAENRIQSFSVAVARDGEIVLAEGHGWQDHDAEEPTTAETTYLVASITKTFTAATLLRMAAEGHLSLEEDFTALSDWGERCARLIDSGIIFGGATLEDGTVIEPPRCEEPITLANVLHHRVNGEPGTGFLYNPVVFGRLSNYLEENTDRSFRDWMYEFVIDPAGLEDTAAGWRDTGRGHVLSRLAPPMMHTDREVDPDGLAHSPLPNPELNASSGIIASAPDLVKYAIALLGDRVLSAELRETMWTPPTDPDGEPAPYAYGWYVQQWNGHRVVWHGGWWPDAYAGLLLIAPDDGLALAALGNTDGIHWGNPLDDARVQDSALAAVFLESFLGE